MEGGRARAATTADGGPPPCLGRTATFSRRGRARGESVEDRMAHAGHAMLDAMKAAGSRLQGRRRSSTPRDTQPVHIAEDTMEKLFGASEESLQRKVETAEHGRLVIHPHSRFRAAWEAVGAALVLTICVMLPVEVAFWDVCTSAESGYAAPPAWRAFTTFVDFFFLTDVVLTFATGYYHEDVLVMAHRRIARRYASPRAIRVAIRVAILRRAPSNILPGTSPPGSRSTCSRRFHSTCLLYTSPSPRDS